MSILIPGMKLPKDRKVVLIDPWGNVRLYWSKDVVAFGTGLYLCKASELPPHGRLGDLDALTHTIERIDWYHQNEEKDMVHGANSFLHQAWYKEQEIYEAIENAETIIPAGGGAIE